MKKKKKVLMKNELLVRKNIKLHMEVTEAKKFVLLSKRINLKEQTTALQVLLTSFLLYFTLEIGNQLPLITAFRHATPECPLPAAHTTYLITRQIFHYHYELYVYESDSCGGNTHIFFSKLYRKPGNMCTNINITAVERDTKIRLSK